MTEIHTAEKADRETWITDKATRCVISQGYSADTAEAFAKWVVNYCPEVQGFANLFDYYMTQQG